MSNQTITIPQLNLEKTCHAIITFIQFTVSQAQAKGVVIGLSGGVDSSLTAALCVRALGPKRVLGILMPTLFTPLQDTMDANALAKQLQISTEYINIHPISNMFQNQISPAKSAPSRQKSLANIRARIRMIILYYYANTQSFLVAGTSDRSETLIGFYTKYGDGGVDIEPLADLYKCEIRTLAKRLDVDDIIINKPPSAGLWPGQSDEGELGTTYAEIDKYLMTGEGPAAELVNSLVARSEHKRHTPPICEVRDIINEKQNNLIPF